MMNGATIISLLKEDGAEDRLIFLYAGQVGQLFANFGGQISTPHGTNEVFVERNGQRIVFDNVLDTWVPLTEKLLETIPNTYTFAPKPESREMEMDYFARGCGLIKHSFVWSMDQIPKDLFAKVASNTNIAFRGRYTVTPWLPHISRIGQLINGWFVTEDDDFKVLYG